MIRILQRTTCNDDISAWKLAGLTISVVAPMPALALPAGPNSTGKTAFNGFLREQVVGFWFVNPA
jgi:hypothetical protein